MTAYYIPAAYRREMAAHRLRVIRRLKRKGCSVEEIQRLLLITNECNGRGGRPLKHQYVSRAEIEAA